MSRARRLVTATLCAPLVLTPVLTATQSPVGAAPSYGVPRLPLGPVGLPQTEATRTLQPGVTFTHIERGAVDPAIPWVVELNIPATESSPDPDAPAKSVQDRASAQAYADKLDALGFPATAQPVEQVAVADLPAGTIGYRVRLDASYPAKADADAAVARLVAAGQSARSWYAGWDGGTRTGGRWSVDVLTIDRRRFTGQLGATFGPDLFNRETVSALAAATHATAAINGGFFVLDPAAGAPGDPAGTGVYDGSLLSEPVAGRPALVLDPSARSAAVVRPVWYGAVRVHDQRVRLDGLNRVPGLIRNCGGDATDSPTSAPLHDWTCTDPSEVVAFTRDYGSSTPAGSGTEIVLDRHGQVVRVQQVRGTTLIAGQRSIQVTGDAAPWLTRIRPGEHVSIATGLWAPGRGSLTEPGTSVVNGGPELLRDGWTHITQARDGMYRPADPSFAYGWVLQRNPRTFAGVDAHGNTVLVTVDGRQLGENGLSIPETAAVAKALGLVDAINLDGGGSTAMVVGGALVGHPSDATGERPVGDAIVIR